MSTFQPPKKSTREIVLDAAVVLLADRGPGITLEEIATRAGLSRQSVYVHFGSRTGLLVALAQHVDADGRLDGLVQAVVDAPSATRALDALAHLHAEYSPLVYPVARVFMAGRHDDDALRQAWDDRMEARRNLYRPMVARLKDEGLLSTTWDVESATGMVSALTSWQVWEQLVIDLKWPKDRYYRYLRATLRGALLRAEEASG